MFDEFFSFSIYIYIESTFLLSCFPCPTSFSEHCEADRFFCFLSFSELTHRNSFKMTSFDQIFWSQEDKERREKKEEQQDMHEHRTKQRRHRKDGRHRREYHNHRTAKGSTRHRNTFPSLLFFYILCLVMSCHIFLCLLLCPCLFFCHCLALVLSLSLPLFFVWPCLGRCLSPIPSVQAIMTDSWKVGASVRLKGLVKVVTIVICFLPSCFCDLPPALRVMFESSSIYTSPPACFVCPIEILLLPSIMPLVAVRWSPDRLHNTVVK